MGRSIMADKKNKSEASRGTNRGESSIVDIDHRRSFCSYCRSVKMGTIREDNEGEGEGEFRVCLRIHQV
ncbi:unnamed protein product [Camellia sinensis]